MTRRPSPNRIKGHRIYTPWEAAEALGVHRQTVLRWVKDNGLIADQTRKPWLITGHDLKAFLGERRRKSRCKLALHHLYCLGCKQPQEPGGKFADYRQQTPVTGMMSALCPACGSIMNKVIRRADLEAIRAKIEVTIQQADPRLVSLGEAPSNVTFNGEARPHVKTHIR